MAKYKKRTEIWVIHIEGIFYRGYRQNLGQEKHNGPWFGRKYLLMGAGVQSNKDDFWQFFSAGKYITKKNIIYLLKRVNPS